MTYYTHIACSPTSADWIPGYMETIPPLVARHGGRYLFQSSDYDRIEAAGDGPALVVLIEWPDKSSAERFYNDPTYQPHKLARQGGSATEMYLIPGTA